MTLVSQELRDGVQKLVERLSSPDDPANPSKPTAAVARMTGPQTSEAQWDRGGMFGIREADPSITEIMIETRIATGASPERVAELGRLTQKRCPMTATVAKAATKRRKFFVNGLETPVWPSLPSDSIERIR